MKIRNILYILSFSLAIQGLIFADDPTSPTSSKDQSKGKEEIAFRNREDSLYKRYEYRNDWDYRQNWQQDPNAYLQGANPIMRNDQTNANDYDNYNTGYNNYRYYNYPDQNYRNEARNSYNQESRRNFNWDYRDNWQYNPGPYLRGEEQSNYNEKRFRAHRRQNSKRNDQQQYQDQNTYNPAYTTHREITGNSNTNYTTYSTNQ